MNPKILLALLPLVGFQVDAFAAIQRQFTRSYTVPAAAPVALNVATFAGDVVIDKGAPGVVTLTVIEKSDVAKTDAEMNDILSHIRIVSKADGSAVSIVSDYDKPAVWSWKKWPPLALTYKLTVPARCDVKVDASGGTTTVSDLTGKMTLVGDTQRISAKSIMGTIDAVNAKGDIAVTSCTGAVTARTMIGGISLGSVAGPVRVSSSGGNISLRNISGPVVVRGNASNIRIEFPEPVKNPADIVTTGGNILLMFKTDSSCSLDLSASVFSHIEFQDLTPKTKQGVEGESSVTGKLNAGGPLIHAEAAGGSIGVLGLEPMPRMAPPVNSK